MPTLLPARWLLALQMLLLAFRQAPLTRLPSARVVVDSAQRSIVIELPPIDLPAAGADGAATVRLLPVYVAEIPINGSVFDARVDLVDGAGRVLPQSLLHHFNLSDPTRRELFVPIALHIMAASKETPSLSVPRFVFGLPLRSRQRLITSAMLANATLIAYEHVRVRLTLRYEPDGSLWPVFQAYPWVMDVLFPVGHPPNGSKAFDLPPGRSERSFESSPAVAGTIVGVGGHLHDYAVSLTLSDVTTGDVLWNASLVKDAAGHMLEIPVTRFYNWHRLGLHIVPAHRYRVAAVYENPARDVIRDGGMGAVAGLFVPDRGTRWPAVDPSDTAYQRDLASTLRADSTQGAMMTMPHMP